MQRQATDMRIAICVRVFRSRVLLFLDVMTLCQRNIERLTLFQRYENITIYLSRVASA